jgi:arylsulfatase A-like enzyme
LSRGGSFTDSFIVSVVEPLLGLRFGVWFTPRLNLLLRGDCGGFGVVAYKSVNSVLEALVGYQVHEHIRLYGGYRALFNAEEEPDDPDYPKDPEFKKRYGPRGVIHSYADGRIEDTGPLNKKGMETIDDEVTEHALRFIDEAHQAKKPFFLWYNTTAMHFRTHCAKKHAGKSGQGPYNDVMVAHDEHIGRMLDKLDDLGIADNTIVMYSTDNGPHYNKWPDAAITPFRSEKNTNWEGGWRVPAFVRWPAKFKAGTVLNGIVSHQDWLPTLLAAAGEPDIKAKLLKSHKAGKKTFKVHIDGHNMLPYLTGQAKESPREFFFYFSIARNAGLALFIAELSDSGQHFILTF